jgi:hypothetical protein
MPERPVDEARERRIRDEIIVDAYGPEEQATGWYASLEGTLRFPFPARCVAERATSPLRVGDDVEVVGMAPAEEGEHEVFAEIPWERRTLAVPLAMLGALPGEAGDGEPRRAVEDRRSWVERGYTF